MRVGYLVNQYPKISHTFIRSEIKSLEDAGIQVVRYSMRRTKEKLVDQLDLGEMQQTRAVLESGAGGLLLGSLRCLLTSPCLFLRGLVVSLRFGRRSDRGTLRHLIYLAEACVLVHWMRRDGVEHLHAHFGTNSATVALLARELGGPPFSFTAHGTDDFDCPPLWSLGEKIERAAFVVAVSSFGRSQLLRWCGRQHWSKIHVIRCGVDPRFLTPDVVPMPAVRRLLSVGRLCEEKGQMLLIEALGRLKRDGLEAELVLIGEGELRAEIETSIVEHGLAGQVHLPGSADNSAIRQALDDACAFVLPSLGEGLPVVIMEAFARGRPVLSTYIAGIPELVVPGQNGWLVPAGSVEALVEALRQVLDTPSARLAELGRAGRARVAEQHDAGRNGRQMADLLRVYAKDRNATSDPAIP
jgi:colanic acid/amylovoran biosynthesis glycosyltransferase